MSSQVIAFTERIEFRTLLEVECKSLTGFAPMIYASVDEFVAMLELVGGVDILVVDEPLKRPDFRRLIESLKQTKCQIKQILILSDDVSDINHARSYPRPNLDLLIKHLKSLLNPSGQSVEGYISIPVDSLVHFKILPIDLYVKLSDDKFVKRIPASEEIDEKTIISFKSKGITELYFEKKYNRDFSLILLNNMINKVEKEYASMDEKFKATSEVFITTGEIVQSLGLPPRIVQVCDSVINRMSEDVSKNKDQFSVYLNQLKSKLDLSFRYRFVELTSFIATQLVDTITPIGNQDQMKKIIFASFFSDVALKKSEHIHCRSLEDIQKLPPEEQKEVNEHAMKASEMVSKYWNAPLEADKIIKQHHGALNGVGFPTDISEKVLPLSKCLFISQELAYAILKQPTVSAIDVVKGMHVRYKGTSLEEFFVMFEASCKNNLKEVG